MKRLILKGFSSLAKNNQYMVALKYFAENKLTLAETALLELKNTELSPPEQVELLKMLVLIQEQLGKADLLMTT
jgi:hypothetical protein